MVRLIDSNMVNYVYMCPFHEMVSKFLIHFMKWTANLTISQNGQVSHPFHEMVNFQFHIWVVTYIWYKSMDKSMDKEIQKEPW